MTRIRKIYDDIDDGNIQNSGSVDRKNYETYFRKNNKLLHSFFYFILSHFKRIIVVKILVISYLNLTHFLFKKKSMNNSWERFYEINYF